MANAKQCDRCKGYYVPRRTERTDYRLTVNNFLLDKCYDLCPKCAEEFSDWINHAEGCPKEDGTGKISTAIKELNDIYEGESE